MNCKNNEGIEPTYVISILGKASSISGWLIMVRVVTVKQAEQQLVIQLPRIALIN